LTPNKFQFLFDILRHDEGIVMSAKHDSKTFMDAVWQEINIDGVFDDFDLSRDDFSDQMVYRAHMAEIPSMIGAFIMAIVVSMTVNLFFKIGHVTVPFTYLLLGSFIIYYVPAYNCIAGQIGLKEYKKFWKILKASRKANKL
jgi:hypothetical protein